MTRHSLASLGSILLVCLLWAGSAPAVDNADTGGWTQKDLTLIRTKIEAYRQRHRIPGLSIALSKDGRLVYAAGFGQANKSTGEEVTPDHLFRIASVSKPITAVAIMKLAEEGKLSLDQKVFGPGVDGLTFFSTAR